MASLDELIATSGADSAPSDTLLAADNHNYPSNNFTFTDPSTWGTGLDNAGKFIVGAGVSGYNSFVNTGVAVSNWFGANLEENNTAEMLANIDSNLGQYYVDHQNAADAIGFIAGSFIPGLGGTKLLNVGQKALGLAVKSGRIGGNIGKAVGLLRPVAEVGTEDMAASAAWATKAGQQMAETQASFSLLDRNVLKSLASGYAQGVLEMAAFQTAATVTMFKSPVLDQADGWDITKDIILSSFEFGAIPGVIDAAKGYSRIKKILGASDKLEKPLTLKTELATGVAGKANDIIAASDDLANTPAVKDILEANAEAGTANTASPEMVRKLERQRDQRITTLNNRVRGGFNSLAEGDTELGNHIADISKTLPVDQIAANLAGAEQIGRVGKKLIAETEAERIAKKFPNLDAAAASGTRSVQYVKLLGEDSGSILHSAPGTVNLADTVKNSEDVLAKISTYGFRVKDLWNPIAETTGVSHLEAEARGYWADNIAKVSDEMRIDQNDIQLQERILHDWNMQEGRLQALEKKGAAGEKINHVHLVDSKTGQVDMYSNPDDLYRSLRQTKQEVANYLLASSRAGNPNLDLDAIAKIANVRKSWLLGERKVAESSDVFARQGYKEEYNNRLVSAGLRNAADAPIDPITLPTWAKIGYNKTPILDVTGHEIMGAGYLVAMAKLVRKEVNNVAAKFFGLDFQRIALFTPDDIRGANRLGVGPKGFASANSDYGTIGSKAENNGKITADIKAAKKKEISDSITPQLYALGQNQEAAIEYESLKNYNHSTGEFYNLSDDGTQLVHRGTQYFEQQIAAGTKGITAPDVQPGTIIRIPIRNQEVRDMIAAEIEINSKQVTTRKELLAAQGKESNWDPATWYPNRPNPANYKHFAIVTDEKVAGGNVGQKAMLHAASAKQLEGMIDKVVQMGDRYKVWTKNDIKEYKLAYGEFDYERTMNEGYIDSNLKKEGINNQFFQQTDGQKIVNDILNHHLRNSDIMVREMMNAVHEPEFKALRELGVQYTNVATSTYTSSYKYAENAVNNPYVNIIKTALDLKQTAEYPIWNSLNQMVDSVYSRAHYAITESLKAANSAKDLDIINAQLNKYGFRSAAYSYDSALQMLANHSAPKDALSGFIRGANAVLSTITLGLDPINALVNKLSNVILLAPEMRSLISAIKSGSPEGAGKLAALKDVDIPFLKGSSYTATAKLIASSEARFFANHNPISTNTTKELDEFYTRNGFVNSKDLEEVRALHADATLAGNETPKELQSRLQRLITRGKALAEDGRVWTGNKYMETSNRWVTADVVKQITDLGIQQRVITEQEALSYINTTINRTQGNYLASQRPIYFQGPIGNAIGLFQTYQFNLMQQLFRHVGEGTGKDAAMLLALQGTIYGMNGLPAFNVINTHIVGTLSSNPQHRDLYSGIYGTTGKSIANWLTYGFPSDLLNTNLYSRGDINPRNLTVIPTNPADVPIVNAFSSFVGNLANVAQKLNDGGSFMETVLQGIEHNGLSRPLAGIAQVAQAGVLGQATATSKSGTIIGSNDLFHIASISRLAGGRPLDEAIANDASYRISAYQAVDHARKVNLDEAVKSAVLAGSVPSDSQYAQFAARYAELGGDQKRFNQYMMKQITSANTPLAIKITEQLKSPYAQSMQQIMGGVDLLDQ